MEQVPLDCVRDGCRSRSFRANLCAEHYRETGKGLRKPGTCKIEGCGPAPYLVRGMCNKHYIRWQRRDRRSKAPPARFGRPARDLARMILVVEQGASGVGGLLEQAEGGPLPWPLVERRLREVYALLNTVRRTVRMQRVILDMEHAQEQDEEPWTSSRSTPMLRTSGAGGARRPMAR